ncbi:MAG: hypothetical protein ACRYG7_13210 [Janthinobacterium lividum]
MTREELKLLFRRSVKVVLGGPQNKTRGTALIASLDALADEATGGTTQINSESIVDATEAGRLMLTARDAQAQLLLVDKLNIAATATHPEFTQAFGSGGAIKWLLDKVGNATVVPQPAAPTQGHVDDTAKVFFFKPTSAYPTFSQYKVAGLPGVSGPVLLDGVNSYVSGELVGIHVNGSVPTGGLSVYVAGTGSIPDGKPLISEAAFTGVATTPTPTPTNSPPAVQVSVGGTATVPQFTAIAADADGIKSIFLKVFPAAGGAAVQTFGPSAPGDTSYVTSWPTAPVGSYLVRAIATDQKDLSTTSDPAVPFTVTAGSTTPPPTGTYTPSGEETATYTSATAA